MLSHRIRSATLEQVEQFHYVDEVELLEPVSHPKVRQVTQGEQPVDDGETVETREAVDTVDLLVQVSHPEVTVVVTK